MYEGSAISWTHDDIFKNAGNILRHVIGKGAVFYTESTLDMQDLFEVSEIIRHRVATPNVPLVLATHDKSWAVGFGEFKMHGQQAAQLALVLQILSQLHVQQRHHLIRKLTDIYGETLGDICQQAFLVPLDFHTTTHEVPVNHANQKAWFLDTDTKAPVDRATTPTKRTCHVVEPPVTVKDHSQCGPCKHYMNGFCTWGTKCRFDHPIKDKVTVNAPTIEPHLQSSAIETDSQSSSQNNTRVETKDSLTASSTRSDSGGMDVGNIVEAQCFDKTHKNKRLKDGFRQTRLWAHIYLYKHFTDFQLVPILIGTGGIHMKTIWEWTGAKTRIRGRGSGHLEGRQTDGVKQREALLTINNSNGNYRWYHIEPV